ncbi:GspH/FimT family pseudopilin [Alteromonas facilis]|uniref:GspH/FimT family pseudopilin n=1 Tax=Alteromonas facilis TaxID=2048004 RepID=UPI000C28A018|nr:GspH/FimT family pseudopilin [Alteromonas facilis]
MKLSKNTKSQGVTLVELLVSMSIVAIILTIALPNMTILINKTRVISELNSLSATIRMARASAIDDQTTITLCPTLNTRKCDFTNWQQSKMVFADSNQNKQRDNNEPLLFATSVVSDSINMHGPNRQVAFHASGQLGTPTTIKLCPKSKNPRLKRALVISLQGRVRLSKDLNDDDIHELGKNKPIHC